MLILAIESSCDETAAAILEGKGNKIKIIANTVASQISIHQKYGGVVPEVAAREHILNIIPVVNETLLAAGLTMQTAPKKLKAIAVTAGPGLITSLMIGLETAKTLAYAWNLPIVPVNHIEGHIYAGWLAEEKIELPAIIMTVSGGHNMLILMNEPLKYKLIGDTRDDAAGEAFDKAAKILGLGYPGGPAIAQAALEISTDTEAVARARAIALPRPMLHEPNFDFSFSGLKTALLYKTQKDKDWQNRINEYALEFQEAVAETISTKTIKAAKKYKAKTVLLVGGVSANKVLRAKLAEDVAAKLMRTKFVVPPFAYTTDNAAMIAAAGYFKFQAGKALAWHKLQADPNLDLK